MSAHSASTGPQPAPGGGVQLPPTAAQLQEAFDNGIWYLLCLWPALHVAVQDSWGGPASGDKRDWFAGAVSDLFNSRPDTDHDDLVSFLLQVMQDEFECNVEDDSEEEVAGSILSLKKRLVEERDLTAVREVELRWRSRGQMKVDLKIIDNGINEEVGDDEEWEGFDDDDVNMDTAQDVVPDLVPALKKEKPVPEVDEEGFTKVTKKKR